MKLNPTGILQLAVAGHPFSWFFAKRVKFPQISPETTQLSTQPIPKSFLAALPFSGESLYFWGHLTGYFKLRISREI